MRRSRPYLLALLLLTLASLISLCVLAPRMYPLHAGTSAEFWYATTDVDLGGAPSIQESLTIFDQGRFVYGSGYPFYSYHDNPYQTVSLAEAEREFPAVQRELTKRATLNDPRDVVVIGYLRWLGFPAENRTLPRLFDCIDAARLNRKWDPDHGPPAGVLEFKQGLMHVSRAARLYWVCFVFEALYLTGIVWFAFWPYLRDAVTWRKLLHVAAVPFLLYLPLWFGYCNSASPAFPRGGILYPYLCDPGNAFPRSFTWEFQFLSTLPPFLSVITQGRAVTYADYFTLRQKLPVQFGPVNVALLSAALIYIVGSVHLVAYALRKRRDRRPGFPVLIAAPRSQDSKNPEPTRTQ